MGINLSGFPGKGIGAGVTGRSRMLCLRRGLPMGKTSSDGKTRGAAESGQVSPGMVAWWEKGTYCRSGLLKFISGIGGAAYYLVL